MRIACITCQGDGSTLEARQSLQGPLMARENCRTCGGSGWYDSDKGPGVNHARRHGSGVQQDAK